MKFINFIKEYYLNEAKKVMIKNEKLENHVINLINHLAS